jgi:cupin 2 domain-containing protein
MAAIEPSCIERIDPVLRDATLRIAPQDEGFSVRIRAEGPELEDMHMRRRPKASERVVHYGLSKRRAAMVQSGNLFANISGQLDAEETTILAERAGATVERIVSTGQASPPGFWYDQDWAEWVVLLQGAAGLLIEGEERERAISPGDYVEIPAHVHHRVEWTLAGQPTVWLAVHWKAGAHERSKSSA